jgi:mannose-6-phosphate isomerase-like protein (cupin superfamily)
MIGEKVIRPWGFYQVIFHLPGAKTKLLQVDPGKSLSNQRHTHRAETWVVESGDGAVLINDSEIISLSTGDVVKIAPLQWHQLYNDFNSPLRIIEVQHGPICEENDIERK